MGVCWVVSPSRYGLRVEFPLVIVCGPFDIYPIWLDMDDYDENLASFGIFAIRLYLTTRRPFSKW